MRNKFLCKTISFILGFVIMAQLVYTAPVFAEEYLVFADYDDFMMGEVGRPTYPSFEAPRRNPFLGAVELGKTLDEAGLWPEPPVRMLNSRFVGWFAGDVEVFSDTPITSDLLSGYQLCLTAQWVRDDCADIESAEVISYDRVGDILMDGNNLMDENGNSIEFSEDVSDYYIKALNNSKTAGIRFMIHEPDASYTVSYNGEPLDSECTDRIEKIQWIEDVRHDDPYYATGQDVMTDTVQLQNGDNVIAITVTSANSENVKTYTFHIQKSSEEIKLNFGNTPYGRIDTKYHSHEESCKKARNSFCNTYRFDTQMDLNYEYSPEELFRFDYYNPNAWGEGEEVATYLEPGEGEYRNYDKDEIAIVAYIGSRFTDTGFTVYDSDGNEIALNADNPVKRTITYDTVASYDFSDFNNIETKTRVDFLTGAEDDNVISLLQEENVRPGVYNVNYEYGDGVYVVRKLIVLPKPGDLNMDGYVNSLDVTVYDRADRPTEDTLSGRLYLYRTMDLNQDGTVDENDAEKLRERTSPSVKFMYPEYSITEPISQVEYTPSETEDNSKAQLYMEYLGKNNNDITASADNLPSEAHADEILDEGDVFWVGYRIANTDAVSLLADDIHSLTLSIDYDSRYLTPEVVLTDSEKSGDSSEQWLSTIKKYNEVWSGYTFTSFTNPAFTYSANNSTALTSLNTSSIRTLIMDITANGNLISMQDGYILRVPFRLEKLPPEDAKIIEDSLDANTFNMTLNASANKPLAWDTSGALSNNLADIIDFRGPCALYFKEEEPPINLNEALSLQPYDAQYGHLSSKVALTRFVSLGQKVTDGALPKGVKYNSSTRLISGAPAETGTFIFYVGNVKLSLTINKAPMTVTAVDKTKRYGDDNPEFTFEYNEEEIMSAVDTDGLNSEGFLAGLTPPEMTCDSQTTGYEETAEIKISGGGSDNYYFVYEPGTLTVNEKRPITITDLKIPVCTAAMAFGNTFPYAVEGSSGTDDDVFAATGIINDDEVKVNFEAVYDDNTAGKNIRVGIQNITFDDDYGNSKNYTPAADSIAYSNNGEIESKTLSSLTWILAPQNVYTYGTPFSFNNTIIRLRFSTGESKDCTATADKTLDEVLAEYDLKIEMEDSDGVLLETPLTEGYHLTSEHNGLKISVVPTDDNDGTANKITTNYPFDIRKKEMHVKADDISKVYGEPNPSFTLTYNADDFAYDETATSTAFTDALVSAPVTGSNAVQASEIGTYDITVSGGTHHNYSFTNQKGTLSITERTLKITSIDDGIPPLTAKDIVNNNNTNGEFIVQGEATASQVTAENVYNNDDFKITYDAVYKTSRETEQCDVELRNIKLDKTYAKGKNYTLDEANLPTSSDKGVVYPTNIESMRITQEPRLQYEYGESFDLSSGKVELTLDNGDIREQTFAQLIGLDDIELIYATDARGAGDPIEVKDGVKLTVRDYNGRYISISVDSIYDVEPLTTDPLEISQKEMEIRAVNTESVYGDEPVLEYEYNADDFVEGDDENSDDFKSGLVAPTLSSAADATTEIGKYEVTLSGASSDNYKFTYTAGEHEITPRKIDVNSIINNEKIPKLTSKIIFENPGEVHKLDGTAETSDLDLTNLIGTDPIQITYKAVYDSTVPTAEANVSIEDIQLVSDYGKSKNYELTNTTIDSVGGGRIYDKEIISVEIVDNPKLSGYEYGSELDLSGGSVTITYDSGLVEDNLTFDSLTDHRITLTYTDTEAIAANGDELNVPDHNGKTITLTPSTTHTDVTAPVTGEMVIEKKEITVSNASVVDKIVYNGKTLTTGTLEFDGVINNDTVTATATFNFDTSTAGEDKIVHVTDITLSDAAAKNYRINSTAELRGKVEKADIVPTLSAENVLLSEEKVIDVTEELSITVSNGNIITVNAPALTQFQLDGGAEYEYSMDGGATWQKSNVFEDPGLDADRNVCIRIAETANYNQSEPTASVPVKTYKNRITLVTMVEKEVESDDPENEDAETVMEEVVFKIFYTNDSEIEKVSDFKEYITDTDMTHYYFYTDDQYITQLMFPLELDGDMKIYTKEITTWNDYGPPKYKDSSSGGPSGPKNTPTPESTPTASPEPTSTPEPTAAPMKPYMSGYDNMIHPDDYMTRAEAATIMLQLSGMDNEKYENTFPDVSDDAWYADIIAQTSAKNLIYGFEDGTFRPEETVTREQYAVMISNMIKLAPAAGTTFSDVKADRWSAGYINSAVAKGMISGYEDGTFAPEMPIRRSEAARMTNVAIGRSADKEILDKIQCPFTDLSKEHWAYYEFMLASCEF